MVRSPSSPLPITMAPQHYYGSDDDEDLRQALDAKENFRRKNSRSTSQSMMGPASPYSNQERIRDRSESRQRGGRRGAVPTQLAVDHAGDLRAIKGERQAKKDAAARELEERRMSLARRPSAPAIPHPDELFPSGSRAYMEFLPPKDLPARSQTVEPGATRGTYSNRGPQIGLPATPKAMRLVRDPESGNGAGVPVPRVPAAFAPVSSNNISASRTSPTNAGPGVEPEAPLTLLPSTVYSPPPRQAIPRSMSAPPQELVPPKTVDHGALLNRLAYRPSHDSNIPPPPQMLQELQHLAMPPPPPPAPLPYIAGNKPVVYGGKTSGTIEIVMDDEPPQVPVAIPVSEATVPIIAPPAPPASRNSHHRGRSSIDHSITGRISRATERMRSASRSRTTTPGLNRNKSPEASIPAPYESVPSLSFQARADQRQPEYRTGLHESEMI